MYSLYDHPRNFIFKGKYQQYRSCFHIFSRFLWLLWLLNSWRISKNVFSCWESLFSYFGNINFRKTNKILPYILTKVQICLSHAGKKVLTAAISFFIWLYQYLNVNNLSLKFEGFYSMFLFSLKGSKVSFSSCFEVLW